MRVLQINACYPDGSTGANTRDLHQYLIARGHTSHVAAPTFRGPRDPNFYTIGTPLERRLHAFGQRISGYQAHGSRRGTDRLCRWIETIKPDVIHLQNVHSHFLNLPRLLRFIAEKGIALCLTLHDCWFFTGGCVHYTQSGCDKWRTGCGGCPKESYGIKTWFFDRSAETARERRELFAGIEKLGVIGVSDWVLNQANESYILKDHPTALRKRIYNWIDDQRFRPTDQTRLRAELGIPEEGGKMILGVSAPWTRRKGLDLFLGIAPLLNRNERIVLAGPEPKQELPENITAVGTVPYEELPAYYAAADVFVQGSKEETFGKVTAESLLCGTPAIAYDATGNSELITPGTGALIPTDATPEQVMTVIRDITAAPKPAEACHARAQADFAPEHALAAHLDFYTQLLG